jgi:hypothetical protein
MIVGKIVYSSYGNPYCEYNMAGQCAYIHYGFSNANLIL